MKHGLFLSFEVEGKPEDTFDLMNFNGSEYLSQPFSYNVLASAKKEVVISANDIVDKSAKISIKYDGKLLQSFHGIVRQFTRGNTGKARTHYHIKMVSPVFRLLLRQNSRIFQFKTVEDIIKTLLDEMKIVHYEFSLRNPHAKREFCMQYRESDLAFVQRLCAEEGIVFVSLQQEQHEKLFFFDHNDGAPKQAKALLYNNMAGGMAIQSSIRSWEEQQSLHSASVQFMDYSFKNPDHNYLNNAVGTNLDWQRRDYEFFDYPGRYKNDEIGEAFANYKLDRLRSQAHTAKGGSNDTSMAAGKCFKVLGNKSVESSHEWMPVCVLHFGDQSQSLEEEGGEGQTNYSNSFVVAPLSEYWRVDAPAKPTVDGPQIAKVVGPKDEEIFCDEFGRVKVKFPWDREVRECKSDGKNEADDYDSCWIRVSQGWAGAHYGMIAIPRVGHEVIVDFLNGDPDQPIITGRVYNANNLSPDLLPNHKTRTLIRTDTYKGDGFNELRFEDEATREQIYLHAQKDMDLVINHIRRESIGVDQHVKVGRHRFELITENTHRTIGKNLTEEIGSDHHIKVGGSFIQRVGGMWQRWVSGGVVTKIEGAKSTIVAASEEKEIGASQRISVNKDSYLKAQEIVLEAGKELTIKGPGGFIKIDSDGVTIVGKKVKINQGGSPGKGTSAQLKAPEDTHIPAKPDDPDRR